MRNRNEIDEDDATSTTDNERNNTLGIVATTSTSSV